MQRVVLDPIPFLILFALTVLTVWVWRWFHNPWVVLAVLRHHLEMGSENVRAHGWKQRRQSP
jgi:hypothetical protein